MTMLFNNYFRKFHLGTILYREHSVKLFERDAENNYLWSSSELSVIDVQQPPISTTYLYEKTIIWMP